MAEYFFLEQIAHLAALSHIDLSRKQDSEMRSLRSDLSSVIQCAETLQLLNISDDFIALNGTIATQSDSQPFALCATLLDQAPERSDNYFSMPPPDRME